MIAESGKMRPGAMSRRWAISSRTVHNSRTAATPRWLRTLWMPEVRRQRSRRVVGEALIACGSFIADRIGAAFVRVAGADHFPQRDRPEIINALLREIWQAEQ